MMIGKAMIVAALALAASQASAQAYLGGSVGQSDIDADIATGLITGGSVDGKDSAFKLFGGYMFNRHFGLEAAYVDLGKLSYSGNWLGAPVTGGTVELTGTTISALGALPITEQFSLLGKIGLFIWEAKARDTTGGLPFSARDEGTDLAFGIGVGYHFTRNLGVRAEWEMFTTDNADSSLVSLGVLWQF